MLRRVSFATAQHHLQRRGIDYGVELISSTALIDVGRVVEHHALTDLGSLVEHLAWPHGYASENL